MQETPADQSPPVPPKVFTLKSHEIAAHWPLIEPFLFLVNGGDWTRDGVKAELEAAKAQLWGMSRGSTAQAIWITKIEETSKGRRGLLWIAAGHPLEAGLALFREYTEPWLASLGCKSIQIIGRKGWQRVLTDYENAGVVLVKELQ